ncbi:MAG: serine hydrolase, partial [Rhodothermales bacterium]|nr:serine hydrolase [Rhodothermales bacterium]
MHTPILLLVSLLVLAAAPPIVVRHDRDEAAFRALGARYEASLARLRARDARGVVEAEGTLIAPRWVLTAAHVARSLGPEATATVGGRAYGVRSVSIHPGFRGREHDLALVELEAEAAGGVPLPLYRGDAEAGREIVVLGRGMTGTGETGPAAEDGVLRGATNRIDEVAPEWVRFVFDAPGTAGVTDLEGISGPGDSGGPALLVEGGTAYVAGVSSGQDDAATGGQPGRYGVSEYYTRVSHYAAWIDRTMEAAPGEHVAGELGRRLDAYLRAQSEASGFAGSVRVVKDGAMVLDKGYGLADRAQNLPNTATTVFDIGSIAKSFTAEAIVLLERQGRLALTDPLANYFPDLPEDKRGITIQHLLDHAAGLHAYHDTEGDFEAMDRAEALRRIVAQDLLFEPGAAREYSNSGYTLLAALIEDVTGQPFQAFVMEHLVEPTGLTQTGFYGYPAWQSDHVAVGYGPRTLGPRNAPSAWPAPSWAILGAGGMGSTVGDLHRWMQRVMERRGERPPVGTLGGLLDGYEALQEATFVAIGGGDYGFVTATFGFPDGSAVLVASNAAESGQENLPLLESLARMLDGGDPLAPAPRAVLGRADLAEKPEGRTLLDLIDVIATGDEAARRRFIAERMDEGFQQDEENLLGFFGTVHETLGTAPVLGPALAPAPGEVVAYVQNAETGAWLEFTLSVEGRAPHRADGLGVRPQAPPETRGAAPAGTCEDDGGLPDSPRGRAASAFLSAVCTPDEAVHRAFIEAHLAPALVEQAGVDRLLDALARMHRDFGGAADAGVQPAGEHTIRMDIRHDGHRYVVTLEIEPEPPHRISGIDVEAGGGTGPDLPPPGGTDGGGPLSDAEIARRLEAYVQGLAEDGLFSGAVLVARDGEVLFERAYGLADRDAGTPNQIDTRFNMGSMNKM